MENENFTGALGKFQLTKWIQNLTVNNCALDYNINSNLSTVRWIILPSRSFHKKMLDNPKRWHHVLIKNCFLDYSKRWPHYPSFVSTFGHSISLCRPWKHFTFFAFFYIRTHPPPPPPAPPHTPSLKT